MNKSEFRIIIIDDNPKIHEDIIKVLSVKEESEEFEKLDSALFGDKDEDVQIIEDQSLPAFEFDTAVQGKEGVEKIKQALDEGRPYALAFVDVRMPPGWDGIETISHIWEIDPEIQVVICTAYSDYSWEETVEKLGMSDSFIILKKPFDSVAIRQLACAMTRKWLLAKHAKRHNAFLEKTIKEKTNSLQNSLSLLRATIESSKDAVLVVDLKGKIVDYNHNFLKMLDIPEVLLDANDENLLQKYIINKIRRPQTYKKDLARVQKELEAQAKFILHMKNGLVLECNTQPYWVKGEVIGRVWSFHDVTEEKMLQRELEYQASHDDLTGLANRVLLYDRIKKAIDMAERNQKSFAILFFDLDRFKLVNDSLGHEIGDELLCAVADRLGSLIRKSDTISRLGGDEFVILMPSLSNEKDIVKISHKASAAFRHPFNLSKEKISITSSIGVCTYPADGTTVSMLLRSADLAMYRAKEQGGARYHFYTKKLNEEVQKKVRLESELRQALSDNQFFLVYQPQFSIRNNEFFAIEALIRWNHPEKGIILPYSFIPAAEESGLIIQIGEWVIREACKQIKAWHDKKLPYVPVAVNVAAQQLQQTNFDQRVLGILKEFDIPPHVLGLEITENVIITHKEIMHMIDKLHKINVGIILDDFGTGNSGLNYLKQIPVERLKIDRSFVRNISKSRSDEVIIEAIIAMARSMNLKVTAEGVENKKQINFLKTKKCDTVQGFYYNKPLPSQDIERFLKSLDSKKDKS